MKTIKMRATGSFAVIVIIAFVLILRSLLNEPSLQEHVKYMHVIGNSTSDCASPALFEPYSGCCPQKVCPADHFSFFMHSGAANVIGPKICFNNRIIISGGQNNVGFGVNVVVVDGETGRILKRDFFKPYSNGLLKVLKTIQEGDIVLAASFDDPVIHLTDEVRELFAGIGSSMVYSVKYRDSWVFVGAGGMNKESPSEKLIMNDKKMNAYGDWPEMGELGGCFPRKV